jgi:GAF domain-containing protein
MNLIKQVDAIIDPSIPLISNLSNVSSILNKLDDINWCGFYLVKDNYLYLGPFQGDIACTIIPIGKGVCGTSFKEKRSIIVDDVNKFAGHIACSSLSKSEIVVPIIKDGEVKAVIDIDSPSFNRFTISDKEMLEEISNIIAKLF